MEVAMSFRFLLCAGLAGVITLGLGAQALPPVEADALAALNGSPRHGEWVTIPNGQDQVQAWVVYPERADRAPVIVLIHEIFGLTDWVRSVADAYAAQGFLVVAPDLLSGKAPDGKAGSSAFTQDSARLAISKLDAAEVTARLNATAQWATSQPSATKSYGVVGFCWGGGTAYSWATQQPDLKAAVGYYGVAPATWSLDTVQAKVLALYGGSDARVTNTMPDFRDRMKSLGKSYEAEVYDGAGHAFLRQQQGMNGANLKAAQDAWPRSIAFLKAALEAKTSVRPARTLVVPAAVVTNIGQYNDCLCGL
jgi:carboxymethylenebutenolidase